MPSGDLEPAKLLQDVGFSFPVPRTWHGWDGILRTDSFVATKLTFDAHLISLRRCVIMATCETSSCRIISIFSVPRDAGTNFFMPA